jgi:hypothetical protein
MGKTKTYEEKQRDKRIQKQTEKLGGPKKTPQPKTLKKAAQEQFTKARLTTSASALLPAAGFKPATPSQLLNGFMKGYMGLYKEAVPKELRDRIKFEMKGKKVVKDKKAYGGKIIKKKK